VEPSAEHRPADPDLPPSLARALVESAEYALRLRTGEVVHFTRAERHGQFVVLYAPPSGPPDPRLEAGSAAFPHGLEVRISDIVWAARGPSQSFVSEAPDVGPAAESIAGPRGASAGVRIPLRVGRPEPGGPA
jgi:hypothetical protein